MAGKQLEFVAGPGVVLTPNAEEKKIQIEAQVTTGPAGPKGDTGAAGPAGPTGAKGDKGDTGATGPAGAAGAKGATGAAGTQGLKGDTGATGPAGPAGAKGDKGDTGATGPVGAAGAKGATGAAGTQGLKGDTGATGPAGAIGAKGATGAAGTQGLKGDTGATGPAGPAGAKGDKGDTGATGPVGATGAKGATGAAGPQGPKGDAGTTGLIESSSLNLIVDGTNGNDATADNTATKPYKTIQAAINAIPKFLASTVTLRIKAGTYDVGSGLIWEGFTGGHIWINAFSNTKDVKIVGSDTSNPLMLLHHVRSHIEIRNIDFTGPGKEFPISVVRGDACSFLIILYCAIHGGDTGINMLFPGGCYVNQCAFGNVKNAIVAGSLSTILSQNNTTEGNVDYGLGTWAATIYRSGTQPQGTIANTQISGGGQIL